MAENRLSPEILKPVNEYLAEPVEEIAKRNDEESIKEEITKDVANEINNKALLRNCFRKRFKPVENYD
jgi:hypothetical protein